MAVSDKLTVPNLLSAYRIIAFPVVMYFAIVGRESVFACLLIINLITDILDGWIARAFKMETDFWARLDSIADVGTYILAIVGVLLFKKNDFEPYLFSFSIFISLFVAANLLSLLKFGSLPSLHLYSWKIGGYIQGFFFFLLFAFDFYPAYYYFMIAWGILAFCEHICVQLLLQKMVPNQRGLYWVFRYKNR